MSGSIPVKSPSAVYKYSITTDLKWVRLLSAFILTFSVLVYTLNVYRYFNFQWDDGYISFRYAQRLASGQGLTWNIGGDRVEGYTSFLDVVLLAAGIKIGIKPELGGIIIGIISVIGTVSMLVWLLFRQFKYLNPIAAIILGVYLVDSTTAIHTTSGLETQQFVVLLCAAYTTAFSFLDSPRQITAILLSIFVFLSILARPEGVIYGAGLYGVLAFFLFRTQLRAKEKSFRHLAYLAASFVLLAILGLAYAAWKYNYFGYLLPNPFYVKSDRIYLWGAKYVLYYLFYTTAVLSPVLIVFAILLAKLKNKSYILEKISFEKILLTLTPPILALTYYLTIVHEVGGSNRFSYPTYFYFVLALAALSYLLVFDNQTSRKATLTFVYGSMVYLVLFSGLQTKLQFSQISPDPFMQYHFKIAEALKQTGLGSKGTVLCDAAGVIPYVSGFNQIDRVGLNNNYLSGRLKVTPLQRETYLWSQNADVYIGYEPPASVGAERPDDDPRMKTPYVVKGLLGHQKGPIEDRIFLFDPNLLHFRMRELRDHWIWIGEVAWPGWQVWGLKSFIYVRKDSPYAAILTSELQKIVFKTPGQITLDGGD